VSRETSRCSVGGGGEFALLQKVELVKPPALPPRSWRKARSARCQSQKGGRRVKQMSGKEEARCCYGTAAMYSLKGGRGGCRRG